MISVYFLHITHLAQCFFSHTRRMLLNFQPIRSTLKFYLGITKEDCPFIRVAYSDSRSLGLPPNSNRDFLFDIWQDALFLHASENSVTILLSHMNSDTQSEKRDIPFPFCCASSCLFILQSLQDWDFSSLWVYTAPVIQWGSGTAQNL